jgi:SNF2-related domain/Helicase conserved C-terminal domain
MRPKAEQMGTTREDVARLVKRLPLGAGHEGQELAVAAALDALLVRGQRGVVLADEVGFGKTYEALAVLTLLREHARRSGKPMERVLVLCKPSLVKKWSEEISTARADDEAGFPQHLRAPQWIDTCSFFDDAHVIDRRYVADGLRSRGMRGTIVDGTVQARAGLYVVNHDLLGAAAREDRPLLRQLYRTRWDLIIVDEAHHYAKGNRPVRLFAPDKELRNYEQGIGDGQFRWILALTATPFELRPHEIVSLLALVRAKASDLELADQALTAYVRRLDQFFDHRQRSPSDELRRDDVAALKKLRLTDATGAGASIGLERLLGQYVIRNTKSQQERKYFFVNKIITYEDQAKASEWHYEAQEFKKLEDLRSRVAASPLIPFDGADALFYLQLRRVIQDTVDEAREREDAHQTFITTDLRQGLSSYPQIASSKLLNREMESAKRLRRIVEQWNTKRSLRLHPKVRAVTDLVRELAIHEVKKLHGSPDSWISKVLVFNQLIQGTAVQLRQKIEAAVEPVFENALGLELRERGLGTREALAARTRVVADRAITALSSRMSREFGDGAKVPSVFLDEALVGFAGRSLVQIIAEPLRRRCRQTLFLLHIATREVARSDDGLEEWMRKSLFEPLASSVDRILKECKRAASATSPDDQDSAYERAERDALTLLDDHRSVELVGRYDGGDTKLREAHRRNFNLPYNPFVLLVSRVGEEGIDLQKQCRYVIHYDLEWNPAKMEQREGRVDRVGWGRADEKFIDVRFLLLKGTYEERIFHTLMQRDQWFQILIGSKRRELGATASANGDAPEDAEPQEPLSEVHERGQLTAEECKAVMLNLAPPGF